MNVKTPEVDANTSPLPSSQPASLPIGWWRSANFQGIIQDPQFTVTVVRDLAGLTEHITAWEELAASALETNVFYESWLLRPAIEAFGTGSDLQFILIFAPNPKRRLGPPILCGFFPLERRRYIKSLPITTFSLWKHKYCYLCIPLLRAEYAHECLVT